MPYDDETGDGPLRRTQLAAERTWLSWWRTGIATAVAAIGIGAALPQALDVGHSWIYATLGVGYALVAVALFVVGAVRQARVDEALSTGGYDRLGRTVVLGFTIAGSVLTLITCVLLIADA